MKDLIQIDNLTNLGQDHAIEFFRRLISRFLNDQVKNMGEIMKKDSSVVKFVVKCHPPNYPLQNYEKR